jgi:hypothetical protein
MQTGTGIWSCLLTVSCQLLLHFLGLAAASPALTLPDFSLSVAGNAIAFCQLILQALYCWLVAKVSDLYIASVYLRPLHRLQCSLYICKRQQRSSYKMQSTVHMLQH